MTEYVNVDITGVKGLSELTRAVLKVAEAMNNRTRVEAVLGCHPDNAHTVECKIKVQEIIDNL